LKIKASPIYVMNLRETAYMLKTPKYGIKARVRQV